jgi:hypothetical protein
MQESAHGRKLEHNILQVNRDFLFVTPVKLSVYLSWFAKADFSKINDV